MKRHHFMENMKATFKKDFKVNSPQKLILNLLKNVCTSMLRKRQISKI